MPLFPKLQLLSTLSLALFFVLCLRQSSAAKFSTLLPKTLWVYWDTGFESSSLIIKLSLKNMYSQLQGTGWEIRELSDSNLHEYLDEQERSKLVRTSDIHWMFSDQVRLAVIIKYGGVYIDSSCFLMQDFSWLENIDSNPDVVNRHGEQPDVVLFFTTYQSSMHYRVHERQEFLVSPGAENWFIAALPNSTFLKLWLTEYKQYLVRGKEYIQQQLLAHNIQTGALALDPKNNNHYFSMYEAFHAVIQKRQKQLDQQANPRLPLAVMEYNIWFIPAIKGPFRMMYKHNVNFEKKGIQLLTEYSQDELEYKFGDFKYLVKLTGSVRKTVDRIINNQRINFIDNWTLPQTYACLNTYYLVKDSIIDKYLLSYASLEQRSRLTIVEKESVPWLCQKTDIQYLRIYSILFAAVPLLLVVATCVVRNIQYRTNSRLSGYQQSQGRDNPELNKTLAIVWSQHMQSISQSVSNAQRYIINYFIYFALLVLPLEVLVWSIELLTNDNLLHIIVSRIIIVVCFFGYKLALARASSLASKYLLRVLQVVFFLSVNHASQIYSVSIPGNLNQDNYSFYVYGFSIAPLFLLLTYVWIMSVVVTVEVVMLVRGGRVLARLEAGKEKKE